MVITYLDGNFDEVDEANATMRMEQTSELLKISRKSENHGWIRASPYSFGLVFPNNRDFKADKLQKLQRFTVAAPGGQYAPPFPYERQLEIISFYGVDELDMQIPEANALLLAQLYHSSFPIFWQWPLTQNTCVIYDGFYGRYISQNYEPYYSAITYEAMVVGIFGVARKGTLRETRNFNFDQLTLANMFCGLLPVDVILSVLKNSSSDFYNFSLDRDKYQALERLSKPQIRRLMESVIADRNSDLFLMNDALTMLLDVPEADLRRLKGLRDWSDLHERVMRLIDVDGDNEVVIQIPKELIELATHSQTSALKLVPLMRAHEFIEVGETLDICIGKSNYFSKARQGETYCMTGLVDGKPTIAIEFGRSDTQWKILQFRGFQNMIPEKAVEQQAAIETFLNKA